MVGDFRARFDSSRANSAPPLAEARALSPRLAMSSPRADLASSAFPVKPREGSGRTENLAHLKEQIKSRLASGEGCTLAECKQHTRAVVAASEAQATEDFELLAALSEQVADVGSDDVLEALADGAPAFNTDTRELIDSILILGERDGERDSRDRRGAKSAGNTGAAMAKARRKANQRVLDLIDIVSVCRAERVKLLAELVDGRARVRSRRWRRRRTTPLPRRQSTRPRRAARRLPWWRSRGRSR